MSSTMQGRAMAAAVMLTAALFALPTLAEAQGCKWCVTPTDCGDVDEHARDSCTEHAGGGCENGGGICVIIESRVSEDLDIPTSAFVAFTPDAGQQIGLAPLNPNLYAAWDCGGDLLYLMARADKDNSLIPVPTSDEVAARLRFDHVLDLRASGS